MALKAAIFMAGIAAGIALHRFFMAIVLDRSSDSICAYCEWYGRKRDRQKYGRRCEQSEEQTTYLGPVPPKRK